MNAVIFIEILLIGVGPSLIDASPANVSSFCTTDYCYTLYGGSGTSISWYDARDLCQTVGSELVSIQDQATANALQFESNFKLSYTGAWTAGRQSSVNEWRDAAGQMFPDSMITDRDTEGWNCVYAVLNSDNVVLYYAYDCFHDQMLPLCQTQNYDTCKNGGFKYDGYCYNIIDSAMSWYDAYMACKSGGMSMAYSGVETTEFIDLLSKQSLISSRVWLGIQRKPWYWDIATDFSGYHSCFQLTLYRWQRDIDDNFRNEGCLLLKEDLMSWGDSRCNDQVDYFICEISSLHGEASMERTCSAATATDATTASLVNAGAYCYGSHQLLVITIIVLENFAKDWS